jgi:hypothetical protein
MIHAKLKRRIQKNQIKLIKQKKNKKICKIKKRRIQKNQIKLIKKKKYSLILLHLMQNRN